MQGPTLALHWLISEGFEGLTDICADTCRGKLYCWSWPMGVSVIDLHRRKVTANLFRGPNDDKPASGCVNRLLGKTYVLMEDGGVLVLDGAADTVVGSFSMDSALQWSHAACAAPAGRVLCMAGEFGLGALIDCTTDSVVGTFRLDYSAHVIQAGFDGTTFLVATAGYLYVIEAKTGAILSSLFAGPNAAALCHAPDLQKLYCADESFGRLYVFSASGDSLVGYVELDDNVDCLCYSPTDSKLYATSTYSDVVHVVDCAHDVLTTCIEVAGSGRRSPPAYSSFGDRIYFTLGDSLGVIDCTVDSVATWVPHEWHNPCSPQVFPALRLVSVTSVDPFITIFSDPPAREAVTAATTQRTEPTVTRNELRLTGSGPSCLFDLSGRRVLDLLPGQNDLRRLPPGIYFLREQTADDRGAASTRKLVVLQ